MALQAADPVRMMNSKIRIKLGDAEFEAEGTEESVNAQYEQFIAALDRRNIVPTPAAAIAPKFAENGTQATATPFDDSLVPRIFELRQDDVVTLKVLPKGPDKEADSILLLLYGYRKMKNEESVLATKLLLASKYSGVSIYRPAHALAQYESLIIRGGQKKGTTYTLNNQGVRKAEEIAAQIFQ
jgi:hypothetical protein